MNKTLSVAVIGAGPAGLYAVEHLLRHRAATVRVDVIDRLPTPWGLVRAGVAPDHPEKKRIVDRLFDFSLGDERVRFLGNVEVGTSVGVSELAHWYDAVIFATGASGNGKMGIAGEDLLGSWPASSFVGFYNGHPDFADLDFDLTGKRAVIIGNGNVALDLARILMTPTTRLRQTDIADHALQALERNNIQEIILLGRRGLLDAAFHTPELEELGCLPGVDISIAGTILPDALDEQLLRADWYTRRKIENLRNLINRPSQGSGRRITMQFWNAADAILGNTRVEGIRLASTQSDMSHNDAAEGGLGGRFTELEANLVFRAIGYQVDAIAGLPFDEDAGIIPSERGRVGLPSKLPSGIYVTGWAKRGCRGVIGSNRACAAETVQSLLEDWFQGRLFSRALSADAVLDRLSERGIVVSRGGWRNIDRAERFAGVATGRPRVKITSRDALVRCATVATRD